MPRALPLLALALLTLSACEPTSPISTPTSRRATPTTVATRATTTDELRPETPGPTDPPAYDPMAEEAALRKLAEPLPPAPLADPKNTHKPLTPDGMLILEVKPDPAKPGQTKPVRVLVQCEVWLRQGMLEVFLCRTLTKDHETIVRTTVDAQLIHAALVATGAKPGHPVQFVNPKTGEEDYKPASGSTINVSVHYRRDGRVHTHPAQEWIRYSESKKPMKEEWVFAGSSFFQDPDDAAKPPYYMANAGEYVGISNFPGSMLDLPIQVGRDDNRLAYEITTEKVPPRLSKVWVILEAK